MKAGLTVLVAIASASVNAHVKVETVNFDEDLLNTEKNIAGTFAWKEKPIEEGAEPAIDVTFEVKKIGVKSESHDEFEDRVVYTCTGVLTIESDSREKYSNVTLDYVRHTEVDTPFRYDGLYVHDLFEMGPWMSANHDHDESKTDQVSTNTFPEMAQNYEKIKKLYENNSRLEEMKDTDKMMKWTISDKLEDYDDMVKKTAVVKKELEPKKKHSEASTEEEKTQE